MVNSKALTGKRSDVWYNIANAFATKSIVTLKDFGNSGDPLRTMAAPKLAYLLTRNSQSLRLELGISERRARGVIYGAIVKVNRNEYVWDTDYRWPPHGEMWDRPGFKGVAPRSKAVKVSESAAQASKQAPAVSKKVVAHNVAEKPVKVIARDGNMLVLSIGSEIVVAEIKTTATL